MSDITSRLMKIRDRIEEDVENKARLEGELDSNYKRFKKEHGVKTLKEAKKLETELVEKANKLESTIEKGLIKLEEFYA